MTIASFDDVEAEFEAFDDWDDRYRLLIDLGRALPAMPDALKTEATRVRGCASQVWLHPRSDAEARLHFTADSDAAIVKGLVALVLLLVDGQRGGDIDVLVNFPSVQSVCWRCTDWQEELVELKAASN